MKNRFWRQGQITYLILVLSTATLTYYLSYPHCDAKGPRASKKCPSPCHAMQYVKYLDDPEVVTSICPWPDMILSDTRLVFVTCLFNFLLNQWTFGSDLFYVRRLKWLIISLNLIGTLYLLLNMGYIVSRVISRDEFSTRSLIFNREQRTYMHHTLFYMNMSLFFLIAVFTIIFWKFERSIIGLNQLWKTKSTKTQKFKLTTKKVYKTLDFMDP